jgi:hypothetical protein
MKNPLGPLYSFQFVLLVACAVFFYKGAEMENRPGFLWAGMSVGVFFVTWWLWGWGVVGDLAGQAALGLGIAIVRVLLENKKE